MDRYDEFVQYLTVGDFDQASRMISSGQIDPLTEIGPTELAASANRIDIIEFLINYGFDVNATDDVTTPLSTACACGRLEIAALLIKAGAKINEMSDGLQTPLMLAANSGSLELVKLLLQAGAKPNMRDECRLTALDYAAREGHEEIFQLLFPLTHPKLRVGSQEVLTQVLTEREERAREEKARAPELSGIERDKAIAINLLKRGEKIEDIAEMTEFTLEEIKMLQSQLD